MKKEIPISNYCASFIDLLGQKNALKGQGLIPDIRNVHIKKEFDQVVQNSIMPIKRLHDGVEKFQKGIISGKSSLRNILSSENQVIYDEVVKLPLYEEMAKTATQHQRWSDGIVYFTSLNETIKCPVSGVYDIFVISGYFCLLGLFQKQPIRGGIEISWGTELHDNVSELYGPIIANSYELENEIAQYPRIVIGQRAINYLNDYLLIPDNADDKILEYNKIMAKKCLNITTVDQDGLYIVDYLGKSFTETYPETKQLFNASYSYILQQLEYYKTTNNIKLIFRYNRLKEYFKENSRSDFASILNPS